LKQKIILQHVCRLYAHKTCSGNLKICLQFQISKVDIQHILEILKNSKYFQFWPLTAIPCLIVCGFQQASNQGRFNVGSQNRKEINF